MVRSCLLENVRGGKGHRNSGTDIDSSLWRKRRWECCVLQLCIYKFMCSAFFPFRLPFSITPISFISRSLRVLQAVTLMSVLGSFTYLSRLHFIFPDHVCLRYIPFETSHEVGACLSRDKYHHTFDISTSTPHTYVIE